MMIITRLLFHQIDITSYHATLHITEQISSVITKEHASFLFEFLFIIHKLSNLFNVITLS